MLGTATSYKHVFDTHTEAHDDVFFCTADCGWITGHSYVTYGPLLNGGTQVSSAGDLDTALYRTPPPPPYPTHPTLDTNPPFAQGRVRRGAVLPHAVALVGDL